MYEKAENEIAKIFDVVEMYRELHKMSGFINIFMNTKQMLFLDHLERPKIIFKNLHKDSIKNRVEKYKKCFNSYSELKGNLDNLVNIKLLHKIDVDIKDVFDRMLAV